MEQYINLPVKTVDVDGVEHIRTVETLLVGNKIKEDKFISSLKYIPDFQQDKPVFKDAAKLLDAIVTNADDETLREINQAYCDTLYKYSAYDKLSYGAKVTLLEELGFDYVLDLLLHMYDDEYNQLSVQYAKGEVDSVPTYNKFVQQKADKALTKLTTLFNIINVLKGKTLGLELVLQLVDMPAYSYIPFNIVVDEQGEWTGKVEDLPLPGGEYNVKPGWGYYITAGETRSYYLFNGVAWHLCESFDNYRTPRAANTAVLDVYGGGSKSENLTSDLQKRLNTFVQHYMLPLIDVTIKFTDSFPDVYAYPSGVYDCYKMFKFWDYYEINGEHKQQNLIHKVSDDHWYYSDLFAREDVFVGAPPYNNKSFDGIIDLTESYVQDKQGNKYTLYGDIPTLAKEITGTATKEYNQDGDIEIYDGKYLQAPLENYVDIDVTTGDQIDPYWEGDVFHRDTLLRFQKCLVIEAIHLAKTVEQMEDLVVEDFNREYEWAEVWLGKNTAVECESGKDYNRDIDADLAKLKTKYNAQLIAQGATQQEIDSFIAAFKVINSDAKYYKKYMAQKTYDALLNEYPDLIKLVTLDMFYSFEYSKPENKEKVGVVNNYLKFCEATLDANYTGIGDLGILGANDYFIYNGMLMYHGDRLLQVGEDKTWMDVGASHAVSEMYYTPAINNGSLYYIYKGVATPIKRDVNYLDSYETHIVKHPRKMVETMNEPNEELEKEVIKTFVEGWYEFDGYWDENESSKWSIITGYINDFYTAFGICNGYLYKLYKNPKAGETRIDGTVEPLIVYQILDEEQDWTYLTGAAYSKTYEAYGIKNGKLYRISAEGITEIKRTDITIFTGIENITADEYRYTYKTLTGNDTIELVIKEETIEVDNGGETPYQYKQTTFKKLFFNSKEQTVVEDDYQHYHSENVEIEFEEFPKKINSIKVDADLYTASIGFAKNNISSFYLEEKPYIEGWDSSFDCISRYHHCNEDYTTYGICKGTLYAITDEEVRILDKTKTYTAICGFYNANSPRTFAYAIADGKLYEIQGKEVSNIILKDDTHYWTDIHGCTTATNNYVLGLALLNKADTQGTIYKINEKTLAPIDEHNDWTKVFGRYTTSKSVSNNCYGYGIRNNKLYQFTKDGISIISGFWKENGKGVTVNLADYNITKISAHLPNGETVVGPEALKEIIPADNTVVSDYDIYVTYTTRGFDNNTRYRVRTELSDTNYTYLHPVDCRTDVSEDACYDLFDTNTGLMRGFTTRNFTTVGTNIVDGSGKASAFAEKQTYIELPAVSMVSTSISFSCCCVDEAMHPVILDNNSTTGIFYGFDGNEYGLFLHYSETNTKSLKLASMQKNEPQDFVIKYSANGTHSDISLTVDNVFTTPFISTNVKYVNMPKYLGGNGTVFGSADIYLNDSYIITATTRINLYENGRYFSIRTQNQDLIEKIQTDDSQATQKVIEITKADGSKLELSMDELYTQMVPTCPTKDLEVSTDYNYNHLRGETFEGTSKATLQYLGNYVLDETKIQPNIPLNRVCDFDNTGIAENLNKSNIIQFKLSTDVTTPIKIKSGSTVNNQMLYQTEEGNAYTNKYLLQSKAEITSADVDSHAVPSGIIYELNSNSPKTVSKTVTFNGDKFELNPERVSDYNRYWFDSYRAELTYYPAYEYDPESQLSHYIDAYTKLRLDANDIRTENHTVGTADFKISYNVSKEDAPQKYMMLDDKSYTVEGKGDLYLHFDIVKDYEDVDTSLVDTVNPDTPEIKDKLQTIDGQYWNYNTEAYHILKNITKSKELILFVITDDDTSKDQGIFGFPNKAGFGIKDNVWTYTDDSNKTHKSNVVVKDNTSNYIKFGNIKNNKTTISVSEDGQEWVELFTDVPVYDNSYIGYANVSNEMLPFNGTIDLAHSSLDKKRLYIMTQVTTITSSANGLVYAPFDTITTKHAITEANIGYYFTGTLDCYYSKLLQDYTLSWVDGYESIDSAVKRAIKNADPTYDPTLDPNAYDLSEYGIYIDAEPQRWDKVTITYTTVDKAFYMKPNRNYELGMDVIEDEESGKSLIGTVGNPTWNVGTVSDFENGYCTYTFTNEEYLVLKVNLNGDDQAICGYLDEEQTDTQARCIFTENNKVKFFDDTKVVDLFPITQKMYYLKLYMPSDKDHEIEYSLDGKNFVSTGVKAVFSGYETFALGNGFVRGELKPFKGSIELTESYTQADTKTYLFQYYKKVIPYILDGGFRHNLVLTPLLTVRDYVIFAYGFDGQIDMFASGLVRTDTRYWVANQIKVFTKDGELRDTLIRDDLIIDSKNYTQTKETVKVNPADLQCYVLGTPQIGSTIVLTYDTWYLFREQNANYEFKVNYIDDKTTLSFKKEDTSTEKYPEYTIYETNKQDLLVNTGYQLNGTLSIKDSTRGGMKFCDYRVWFTYSILYRKYEDTEWNVWTEFILENTQIIYERCGYDLKGVHHLASSWLKTASAETPFVSFYNNEYIEPVGSLSFDVHKRGEVSGFAENAYLAMKMDRLLDGYAVTFSITTGTNENQGLGTWVHIENGYFVTTDGDVLCKARPNYHYIVQYIFGGRGMTVHDVDVMRLSNLEQTLVKMFLDGEHQITVRILGYNVGDTHYEPTKSEVHTVTLVPYNPNKTEGSFGYYVTTPEQANSIKVAYRKLADGIDQVTTDWYNASLVKQSVPYKQEVLEVYAVQIPFGYATINGTVVNKNPNNIAYYVGDTIEIKTESERIETMKLIPYNNFVKLEEAEF